MSPSPLRTMPQPASLRQRRLVPLVLAALFVALTVSWAHAETPAWVEVSYGPLLDRGRLAHSGETVEELSQRLVAAAGEEERRSALELLEPLVEPYAYLLPDAIDTLSGAGDAPFVELSMLWEEGAPQPAWVELVRARRYVVESDGAGTLRVFAPWEGGNGAATPAIGSAEAARSAWEAAYGVLRHAVASELARRGQGPLEVIVHPYRHVYERALFQLGTEPHTLSVSDAPPRGDRQPLDIASWRRFLEGGLTLEGARFTREGQILLLGSRTDTPPEMLGQPVALSDFAAAYRAIFHGGLSSPFMSLDRAPWPHRSIVSYGGRLKDTRIGLVTLLCDVRFKTFSQGLDPYTDEDVRERIRAKVPDFLAHVEARAQDPRAVQGSDKTRFWFYPDSVDLTLSVEGDVLVFRRARMSAASERVRGLETSEAPPWTQRTIDAINTNYGALAELYPEMESLDQVVRLLSLFTWLRELDKAGAPLPELDALLAVELPALRTPRTFPQLLAFGAIPADPSTGPVAVHGQSKVGRGLDRLRPRDGRPLPDARRAARALAALDRTKPTHEEAARAIETVTGETSVSERRRRLYRADYEIMYRLVLGTLDDQTKAELGARARAGERFVVSGLGMGGLDLRMGQALRRARGRNAALAWGRGASAGSGLANAETPSSAAAPRSSRRPRPAEPRAPRDAWRVDPKGLSVVPLPGHAWPDRPDAGAATERFGALVLQTGRAEGLAWHHALAGRLSSSPRSRRVSYDPKSGAVLSIERVADGRLLSFALERRGGALVPEPRVPALPDAERRQLAESIAGEPAEGPAPKAVPEGVTVVRAVQGVGGAPRITFEARRGGADGPAAFEEERMALRQLVLGRALEIPGDVRAPALLARLAGPLEAARRILIAQGDDSLTPEWEDRAAPRAGEEDAMRLAGALNAYWDSLGDLAPDARAAVATGPAAPQRWEDAPMAPERALLLLPEDAFGLETGALRRTLQVSWTGGPVASRLPDGEVPSLVVLVSAEDAARLGERVAALAGDPAMNGKHLAIVPLEEALSTDAAARLIGRGLAGVGLAGLETQRGRRLELELQEISEALGEAKGAARVEDLHEAIVWHY